jgi:hypothetical protein
MPAALFPHLDAIQAIYDRAAGRSSAAAALGPSLFPGPFVTTGSLIWPVERASHVLHEWARWTRSVPHDVTSVARIVRLPHLPLVARELRGRSLVVVEVAIPREPWIAAGRVAELRRLEPEIDTVAAERPDAVHPLHTAFDVPAPAVGDQVCLESLPVAAVEAFLAAAGPNSGSNLLTASLRHLGPAYAAAAAGVASDADEASRLDVRLTLLAGRLAPYAIGRPPVERIIRAVGRASTTLRRGEG